MILGLNCRSFSSSTVVRPRAAADLETPLAILRVMIGVFGRLHWSCYEDLSDFLEEQLRTLSLLVATCLFFDGFGSVAECLRCE